MKLYLFRHGEAEPDTGGDSQRRLTAAGSRRNRATAALFAGRGGRIEQALVSPYARALETAADLEAELGKLDFRESHLITPDADVSGVIEFLAEGSAESVLLVGHNPLLSRLLSLLTEGDLHSTPGLDTSEMACVSLDVIAPGCGEIDYRIRA